MIKMVREMAQGLLGLSVIIALGGLFFLFNGLSGLEESWGVVLLFFAGIGILLGGPLYILTNKIDKNKKLEKDNK